MFGSLSGLGPNSPAKYSYDLVVAGYGDSTTEGWTVVNGSSYITSNNVPALTEAYIRRELVRSCVVLNKGVGGTQASQILSGADGRNKAWRLEMAESPASLVTFNFCLNDAYYHEVPTPGYEQETPARYQQIVREMVIIAKGEGKQMVLLEPNPVTKPPRQVVLGYYVAALNEVAVIEGVPIVHHYSEIMQQSGWQDKLSDGVHPKDEMYIDKAKREYALIAPIIRSTL